VWSDVIACLIRPVSRTGAIDYRERMEMKAILSIKRLISGQRGFTLVELLLVLVILGLLAAVVSVSVVGLVGRGEEEGYNVDERSIQTAVSTFYADAHGYSASGGGWSEPGGSTSVHNFPTCNGRASYLYRGGEVTINGGKAREVLGPGGIPATEGEIVDAAIWMGLMVSTPGSGTGVAPVADTKDNCAPLDSEHGPYLNEIPQSCSVYNSVSGAGTYTWIVGRYGRVWGAFHYDLDGDGTNEWYIGYSGVYP
jgi:prepilin-type N-terminal cleavage/methylation domain-containing protein